MDRPQDYSARTAYRPPAAWYRRLNNRLGVALTSLGLAPRDTVTLEIRGRRSGTIRRTPIVRTRHDGGDYLVALAGESQWVRHARAAGGHAVIRRRRKHRVRLDELAPDDRGEIIAAYLRAGRRRGGAETGGQQAKYYFGLDPHPHETTSTPSPATTRCSASSTRHERRPPPSCGGHARGAVRT